MLRLWVGSCLLVAWVAGTARLAAADPLDKPAFTATPAELLALARALPAVPPPADTDGDGDDGVTSLRTERDVAIDERGRATQRDRYVFVARTDTVDPDWSGIHAEWRPAYQNQPVLRARVISPSGAVSELDPALIEHTPHTGRETVDSLDIQLPALVAGSVIEEDITTADREPPPGGADQLDWLDNLALDAPWVIRYTLPVARPGGPKFVHVEHKLPPNVRVRHEIVGGNERWTYDVAVHPPPPSSELDAPDDEQDASYIGISAAADWQTVARRYAQAIDRTIAAGPAALPAELPRAPTVDTAFAITAWLHRQIAWSGSEGLLATDLPHPPGETLALRRGNRADANVLLVALLRQAGIRADVAALYRPYVQIAPDLPAISMFTRVLVRARIGARELWLDPVSDYLRPGELISDDQGRKALVLADDTRGLVITPSVPAAANRIHIVRTYTVSELGLSQLTEVVRPSGAFERDYRVDFSDPHAITSQAARDRVASIYGNTPDQITTTSVDDLATPFEITTRVQHVSNVGTDRTALNAYLWTASLFDEVPDLVMTKLDPADPPRARSFVWPKPFATEIENRIIVPLGFELPAPQPEQRRALGTAVFSQSRRIDGRTVIVTLRFESGKPRISPAELAELQTAAQALRHENIPVAVDATVTALVKAGKSREAIAECDRLIALHPKEALHHDQLASVYLDDGAGEAARREARKAVALEPDNADALGHLGWTLSFDSVGRQYMFDWDRAGAIAALDKANKLAPKFAAMMTELARVLSRNSAGQFGEGSDLARAAELVRAANAIEHTSENDVLLSAVLAHLGRFTEAEQVARGLPHGDEYDAWVVTLAAAGGGMAAAHAAVDERAPQGDKHQLLRAAANGLLVLRRYDAARAIIAEVGGPAELPVQIARVLDKLVAVPPAHPSANPEDSVRSMLHLIADRTYQAAVFWDAEAERAIRDDGDVLTGEAAQAVANAPGFVNDGLQAGAKVRITGSGGLWHAHTEAAGAGGRTVTFQVYLALDHGIAKILGTNEHATGVGRFILRGEAKTDARAKQLLDWVAADWDQMSNGRGALLRAVWGPGVPVTHEAISFAAAIVAEDSDPPRTIPLAQRCNSTAPNADLVCHGSLAAAYVAVHRWVDAAGEFDWLLQHKPLRGASFRLDRASALAHAGRFAEADHVFDEVLATAADDHDALVGRFFVATIAGQAAEAKQRAEAVLRHPKVTAMDVNNVAWYQLAEASDLPAALANAKRAQQMAPGTSRVLNTLAAIEAASGDVGRAAADTKAVMDSIPGRPPRDADWFVAGLIDEQLGLTDDAIAAYRRITQPSVDPTSTYVYAQKRLAALKH